MTLDAKERAGWDVWDKVRHKMGQVAAAGQAPQGNPRPADRRPIEPPPDGPAGPHGKPPRVPKPEGNREWWMNKQAPPQWQRQTEPPKRRQRGQGSPDPFDGAPPAEKDRMLRGAFQAGINGDDGAMQSFPNTPFGQRLRQEFMRGRQRRVSPQRGTGISGLDRG